MLKLICYIIIIIIPSSILINYPLLIYIYIYIYIIYIYIYKYIHVQILV